MLHRPARLRREGAGISIVVHSGDVSSMDALLRRMNDTPVGCLSLRRSVTTSPVHFRPILMTTITTVLGLLPLAIAIVGGLLSATVLTLLVVPVLYQMVARVGS